MKKTLEHLIEHLVNFLIGFATTLISLFLVIGGALLPNPDLMAQTVTIVEPCFDLMGFLKIVISTIGGILTAIILSWLKSRYPKLFTKKSPFEVSK